MSLTNAYKENILQELQLLPFGFRYLVVNIISFQFDLYAELSPPPSTPAETTRSSSPIDNGFGISYMEDAMTLHFDTITVSTPREEADRYLRDAPETPQDLLLWWRVCLLQILFILLIIFRPTNLSIRS